MDHSIFLFWVPMNIQKDWKAKLESAYSFMLKYSKITVWVRLNIRQSQFMIHKKYFMPFHQTKYARSAFIFSFKQTVSTKLKKNPMHKLAVRLKIICKFNLRFNKVFYTSFISWQHCILYQTKYANMRNQITKCLSQSAKRTFIVNKPL